ncbi:hypothetical protein BDV28DRAFT_137922 [Aspergillus coremiiformis]|uniref:Uncharacterized protein n=1 Tax=Aspergillus coremiiformis TaxID=138285 RepID=A0A5N6Z274_9EURO|nr:hypothetical protein BDV28DRAFT_137922 [Aspergillus coremiiformis]
MAHLTDEPAIPAHIPPFARPLAPYIKTRQEALRIRQVLTAYLRSQITFADDDSDHPNCHARSHLSLCAPQDAVVDVKRIPPELTGLRKEYLLALQANVNARKEYRLASERHSSTKPQGGATTRGEARAVDPSSELQAYLRLLRDRRQHAKLQVAEHYLEELKARDTIKPENFDSVGSRGQQFALPADLVEGPNGGTSKDRIEELLHNLERAVIRARSQLENEKRLLGELKAQHETEHGSGADISPAAKLAALQQTRDTLVHWVEEKLVSVGNDDSGPMPELPPEEMEKSDRLLEDRKARVAEQYAAYVDARKRLLDAASRACQPIGTITVQPTSRPVEQSKATEEIPSLEPVEVLSFVDELLLPLSKYQRALALQKFYLTGILAKEKSTTLRILNRLSDESHLLPEYPILARQPRFRHAAAAINARHATTPAEPTKSDEVVSLAEAWAFASEAAGASERESVEQNLEEGTEIAQDAEQLLQEVYDILNQDLDEVLRDDRDNEGGREAQSSKSRVRPGGGDKRAKGPWARLDGRIGVTDS